ncbi:MAG: hypothetical protein ACRDT4_13380 [Micromonosporaceae bacterium]
MKALVCLLFVPLAIAVWILGSPRTAWRVIAAFRRRGDEPAPQGTAYTMLRVGATLALVSVVLLLILISQSSD